MAGRSQLVAGWPVVAFLDLLDGLSLIQHTNGLLNHVIYSGHMGSIVCATSMSTQLDFTQMGQLIILVFGASTSGISIAGK